jgi:hydrogen peroxide-dependent heme synthase
MPLTIEGAAVLHQMFRLRRTAWRALPEAGRAAAIAGTGAQLEAWSASSEGRQSVAYAVLGHKCDLLLIHLRRDFRELAEAQAAVANSGLGDYLEPVSSFASVVEMSLHDATVNVYSSLAERGIEPHTEEWKGEVESMLARQRQALAPRLWPEIPESEYVCFYPMSRKRGENVNWYLEPLQARQQMMLEHGVVGRRYADDVKQIITGSIGLDDWEWGVDLFGEDPLIFKKLVYEMRFDRVSAAFAEFGSFYIGARVEPAQLAAIL